jgi:hypothetical protein
LVALEHVARHESRADGALLDVSACPLQLEVRAANGQRIHLMVRDVSFQVGNQCGEVHIARCVMLPQADEQHQQDQHADGNHQNAATGAQGIRHEEGPPLSCLRQRRPCPLVGVDSLIIAYPPRPLADLLGHLHSG